MRKINYFCILVLLGLSSCRITKYLPQNEFIYGGANLNLIVSDSAKVGLEPNLKTRLEELTRPLENTKFPGLNYPYRVAIYYATGGDKGKKGFFSKLTKRFSEKPVFFNDFQLDKNKKNLQEYLETQGYFDSKVNGEIKISSYKASANYDIQLNQRFAIDTVMVFAGEGKFDEDFKNAANKVTVGTYFDLDKLKASRLQIDTELRKNGYFKFNPDYVAFLADSIQKAKQISIKIKAKEDMPSVAKKQYLVNDIYINIDGTNDFTSKADDNNFDFFRGIILDDVKGKFKENIFADAIAFRPGTLFNTELQDITNSRLVGLGNFNFIKSRYEVVNRLDSTFLDVYYYLQTQKQNSLRAEANAVTRSSGLAGSQLSLNYQNINTFKGGEFFKVSVKGEIGIQIGGKQDNLQYRDNYRLGGDAQFTFPRFLAPFVKIDPEVSRVLPKTQISGGYESFIKKGLYNLNSASGSWGYAWTRGRGVEHEFKPFSLKFVKSSNISSAFIDEIFIDPRLLVILENQLIVGGSYNLNYRPKRANPTKSFTYNGTLEFAGNMFSLLDKIRNNPEKSGRIFGEYYSQFVKLENDFRYRKDLSKIVSWANRAIVGVGVPFGNSLQLPFLNQFYVGGNNSLRAFRARGVGPGTYKSTNSITEQFIGNNTGDVKLELNTELRLKANDFFSPALFFDAGNIWMFKDEYIYGSGSLLTKDFYKELAMGAGLGLRFNFSFIIFRLDIATPVRKPWLYETNPWVLGDINPFNKSWRKDNLIWNVAIGLPF